MWEEQRILSACTHRDLAYEIVKDLSEKVERWHIRVSTSSVDPNLWLVWLDVSCWEKLGLTVKTDLSHLA